MPRLELNSLLRPSTTPEQSLFLSWFYSQFDNGSAVGRRIVNVEPIHYTGLIAGSEFLVYAATKLYLCYNVNILNGANHGVIDGNVIFYNQANAIFLRAKNQNGYYDLTALNDEFMINPLEMKNFYFSRFTVAVYSSIIFNGYRITLL